MNAVASVADRTASLRDELGLTGRTWVGFSGGLDSSVLLHALSRSDQFDLVAVYVDHGLAEDGAAWRAHVSAFAAGLGVPLTVRTVTVRAAAGDSVEARAREARYAAFADVLAAGDAMLTAQHASDQAETLLLQLLRGAGVAGLAAMAEAAPLGAGWCLRPLLGVDRPAIESYAAAHGLRWHDDPSNADTRFSRNYLRAEVLPALRRRWPALSATLSRSAALQADAQSLLDQLAAADAHSIAATRVRIPAAGLAALPAARQRNVLRFLLASRGLGAPPARRMASILALATTPRSGKVAWDNASVRRYRDTLYVLESLPAVPPGGERIPVPAGGRVTLPCGLGDYGFAPADDAAQPREGLRVGFRSGGERVPLAGGGSTPLSKWFQARGVPPWARKRTPLLLDGDRVVAVGEAWVDPGATAASGSRLRWTGRPVLW